VPLLTQGHGLKAGALVFVGAKKPLFRAWPPASPAKARAKPRAVARPTRRPRGKSAR
jgi:hypothetical protein